MKAFTLLMKCINSSAVEVMLMECMHMKQIIMCLLRLEIRYGRIFGITRDSGTNMITDENRNLVKEYTAPVDAQFRNYSKRSTGLIKKYLRKYLALSGKAKKFPGCTSIKSFTFFKTLLFTH